MKSIIIILLIITISFGCFSQANDTAEIAIDTLTTRSNLDYYVGKLVTIKGEISNTKIPQILGIDIDYTENDPNGKMGIATGVLIKTVVLEENIKAYSQNRGAGIFYRLKEPDTEYDAKVKILKN